MTNPYEPPDPDATLPAARSDRASQAAGCWALAGWGCLVTAVLILLLVGGLLLWSAG